MRPTLSVGVRSGGAVDAGCAGGRFLRRAKRAFLGCHVGEQTNRDPEGTRVAADAATRTSEPLTAKWQRWAAGLGLGLVTLFAGTPVALALVLLWASVLGVAGAQTLHAADVLRARSFSLSVGLSVAAVTLGAVVSLGARLPRALRRRPAPTQVDGPARPGRWLLHHPWMAAGLLFAATDVVLVPLDRSGVVDVHSVLIGTLLIGTAFWLIGTLAYALLRGWMLVLELVWAGVRRSSFFAGMVVVGALGVTVGANLLWRSLTQSADQVVPTRPAATFAGCDRSGIECARVVLESVADGGRTKPTSTPLAPAEPTPPPPKLLVAAPEPPSSFERCVEELHRSEPGFESARSIGIRMAQKVLLDQAAAEDVVHSMMEAVCLGSERIADVRSYFIRSVSNAAGRQRRASRKWCPLDPEDPRAGADQCIAASLAQQAVQEEMEAAAWQGLCELNGEDRRVIELRFWENLSHAQVAARLGLSEAAARKRYSRALAALKERFDRRCR
jgi:RNA polymerase sigma factor (sigma-70 family)